MTLTLMKNWTVVTVAVTSLLPFGAFALIMLFTRSRAKLSAGLSIGAVTGSLSGAVLLLVRYRHLKTSIQHTGQCDQRMVRARDVEAQVAQYLMSFHLPPNWREEVLVGLCSPEDRAAMAQKEQELRTRLERLMEVARTSLEIKRRVLEHLTKQGLYPYSRFYLQRIAQRFGSYWSNHFSTIGLLGMTEDGDAGAARARVGRAAARAGHAWRAASRVRSRSATG